MRARARGIQLLFYFMRFTLIPVLLLLAAAAACQRGDPVRDYESTPVTLPNGKVIRAEVMRNPTDVARGLMFRESLPADRGALLQHNEAGRYPAWMYQTKIPLDIIWLDVS